MTQFDHFIFPFWAPNFQYIYLICWPGIPGINSIFPGKREVKFCGNSRDFPSREFPGRNPTSSKKFKKLLLKNFSFRRRFFCGTCLVLSYSLWQITCHRFSLSYCIFFWQFPAQGWQFHGAFIPSTICLTNFSASIKNFFQTSFLYFLYIYNDKFLFQSVSDDFTVKRRM